MKQKERMQLPKLIYLFYVSRLNCESRIPLKCNFLIYAFISIQLTFTWHFHFVVILSHFSPHIVMLIVPVRPYGSISSCTHYHEA